MHIGRHFDGGESKPAQAERNRRAVAMPDEIGADGDGSQQLKEASRQDDRRLRQVNHGRHGVSDFVNRGMDEIEYGGDAILPVAPESRQLPA